MAMVYRVIFKKKNGEIRELLGTDNLARIPKEHHPKGTGKISEEVEALFDLEKKEWRSYRKDSIISKEIVKAF